MIGCWFLNLVFECDISTVSVLTCYFFCLSGGFCLFLLPGRPSNSLQKLWRFCAHSKPLRFEPPEVPPHRRSSRPRTDRIGSVVLKGAICESRTSRAIPEAPQVEPASHVLFRGAERSLFERIRQRWKSEPARIVFRRRSNGRKHNRMVTPRRVLQIHRFQPELWVHR